MDFKAIKEHVKNNSIVDFCNQSGIGLTGNGRYRRLEKHDSCVIDTMRNEFYWNSLGKNGDIINFVQTYYETDFKTAVEIITGKNLEDFKEKFIPTIRYSPPDKSKEEKSPKSVYPSLFKASYNFLVLFTSIILPTYIFRT